MIPEVGFTATGILYHPHICNIQAQTSTADIGALSSRLNTVRPLSFHTFYHPHCLTEPFSTKDFRL